MRKEVKATFKYASTCLNKHISGGKNRFELVKKDLSVQRFPV